MSGAGDRQHDAPPPPHPVALENDYVRVSRDAAPFAAAGSGDRVIVAMAPLSFMAGDALQRLERGIG